jgi:predicted PhzF superfamily epimerase YddE/YHI9
MGRPSVLEARTRRDGGQISAWIGGHSVLVADGFINVE